MNIFKKFFQISSKTIGHHFDEFPGSGSAFIIHQKVFYLSFLNLNGLGILSAHINNGSAFLKQHPTAATVTGDLRNHL